MQTSGRPSWKQCIRDLNKQVLRKMSRQLLFLNPTPSPFLNPPLCAFKCTPSDHETNKIPLSLHFRLLPRITGRRIPKSPTMRPTFALSLLSGPGTLALPRTSATTSHKVSLSQYRSLNDANGRANIPGIFASVNATLEKLGGKPLPYYEPVALQQAKQAAERRNEKAKRQHTVPLKDQEATTRSSMNTTPRSDLIYYGPVTIGSGDGNAQTFEL